MDSNKDRFEITEMFMAQADINRRFYGTIRRDIDGDGNPVVYGKIKVLNGSICAQAEDQWKLGDMLDTLVLMILDYGLHSDTGKTSVNAGETYFLN
jgi:hypothetical protein